MHIASLIKLVWYVVTTISHIMHIQQKGKEERKHTLSLNKCLVKQTYYGKSRGLNFWISSSHMLVVCHLHRLPYNSASYKVNTFYSALKNQPPTVLICTWSKNRCKKIHMTVMRSHDTHSLNVWTDSLLDLLNSLLLHIFWLRAFYHVGLSHHITLYNIILQRNKLA